MKNNRTNSWILWSILVIGLLIAAGCGSNPTTPGPSDVQDFGYDGDGLPSDSDMEACLAAFNVMKNNGGGVTTVVNDHGYTLIGGFERWSGVGLEGVRLTIHEGDGTTSLHSLNGKIALTDLVFPIIATAYVPGYTAETIVGTSGNVIAFGLELLESRTSQAMVVGISLSGLGAPTPASWQVAANSTHNRQWEYFQGGPSALPHAQVMVDANRPVGAVAILSSLSGNVASEQEDQSGGLAGSATEGYSYGHIGVLDPGAVGAWVMDINEEGPGTDRGTANYSFTNLPADPEMQIGYMNLTPGGVIDSSEEFVPYYIGTTALIAAETGEYSLTSYDPPAEFDRDVVQVRAKYFDGSAGMALVDWNVGGGLPDIALGDVPTVSNASVLQNPSGYKYFNCDWDGPALSGYIIINIKNSSNDTIWEIQIEDDATSLSEDTILVPTNILDSGSGSAFSSNTFARVCYITCDSLDIDDFTVTDLYSTSTDWSVSIPEQTVPEVQIPSDTSVPLT